MIGGLVLAAGGGKRFGSTKQVAELDGRPLVAHAVEAMQAVPSITRIVVTTGSASAEVGEALQDHDVDVAEVEGWKEGLAASLRAGIEALADTEKSVVTLADEPFVTPQIIEMILAHAEGSRSARALYGGQPGHPAVIDRGLYEDVLRLRGDDGARDLLKGAGARTVECGHLAAAFDVDTKADLQEARRLTGNGG